MPTETIGRYEIDSVIGRGAMAVVYKATDPTIGRTVALKTMRFDVNGIEKNEVLGRFRNEARAAGKLLHPNLVTIYDAGEQEGTFYIAMECVEGHTLQAMLSEQRFLQLDRTVDIVSQICAGLDYAHANGVIHRDIKPANVMITRNGVIKIMDFGIAKSGAQLTTGGDVLGTPNYISPEMVKGDPIDGRSDLFSVAVILHEMLLGQRPFTAPNISTIIYKIVNEPVSPDLETKVHPALAAILRKALSKHPSDRYQTGADLANALKSYQAMLAEPGPTTVVPGTSVTAVWPAISPAAEAMSSTPARRADMPATPPPPPEPAYEIPEVFGSDVPEVFRKPSPVPLQTNPAAPAPLPPLNLTPPAPPAPKPVAASFNPASFNTASAAAKPAPSAPPPVFGAQKIEQAPPTPPPVTPVAKGGGGGLRVVLVAVITVFVLGAVFAGYKYVEKKNNPAPGRTVAAPDPVAITQTESAKTPDTAVAAPAPEPTEEAGTEIEGGAKPAAAAAAAPKKKPSKPEAQPAPVASAPVPAPVTTANLAISSDPDGAAVQLDGQNRSERTPFTASALSAGPHTLIFTKPGYVPLTRNVAISAGNNTSVSVNLTVAATEIAFDSTPQGATIFVDDEPTGQVTPATIKMSPGAHAVSIAKPGFDEGTGNVRLEQGETQHFSVVLQPGDREGHIKRVFGGAKDKGMIIIRSRPRGAHIKLDDNVVDASPPARIIVRNGKMHLTVQKDGFKPYQRDLKVEKGDILVIDAILEAK